MDILTDIIDVAIYSCIGIVLMILGNFLIDLIIPCSFPEEIKKGNQAVGFVSAGTNIGVGLLLRAAISSPAATLSSRAGCFPLRRTPTAIWKECSETI